jgi:hypothetical protein
MHRQQGPLKRLRDFRRTIKKGQMFNPRARVQTYAVGKHTHIHSL